MPNPIKRSPASGSGASMHHWTSAAACLVLAACAEAGQGSADADAARVAEMAALELPAGQYTLDPAHTSVIFRVSHLGFSNYTARFTRFDATLELDPAEPGAARLTATIDPASIETDYPDPETLDFDAMVRGEQFLDADRRPQMRYRSTAITLTAPNAARIDGELTLHGETRLVALDAVFNGGYAGHPLDPNARIGFSARGTLSRSAFGIGYGVPEPGSTIGVGDEVEIIIETEFNGPPWAQAGESGE